MARPKRTVLEYRNYELPADFPILALTGDQWHISPIPGKHLHFHNCLEIGICHSSGGTMLFDKQRVDFHAGDVTCIARNVPHTTWSNPDQPSLWSYLFLDPEALLGAAVMQQQAGLRDAGRFLSDCHLLLPPGQHPWAAQLVNGILAEMTSCAPGYQQCVISLCTVLLISMLRVYSREDSETIRDPDLHVISPALDYVHEHYMHEFPQDTLANACHLSPTHFRRLFKEQTGTSPLAFLHQTRILKSCTLLRSSQYSIAQIAGLVGYNSLSSYNRHFIQAMGCTPTVWRKTSKDQNRPSLLTFSGWTEAEKLPSGNDPE